MNWYLFALYVAVLVFLLMIVFAILSASVQIAVAKRKQTMIEETTLKLCEKTVGRTIGTIEDSAKELMDYAMDKTRKMVEDTFKNES